MRSFIFLFLFISISTFGQVQSNAPWLNDINSENKSTELTIDDIKQRAENYFITIDTEKKGSGYKPYNRWLEHWSSYQTDNGTIMSASDFWKAWETKNSLEKNQKSSNVMVSNWQSIGPYSFVDVGSWSSGQGRVNVILVDPNNPNTYYIGAPAGGLWKSLDAGITWNSLTDELPQIGVSGIAIDPLDSNIIYITTGDDDAGDTFFIGVMKSIDGGITWQPTGYIPNGSSYTANEIYIDPTNSNKIWVATSNGLYLSSDYGASWNLKLSGNIRDFKLKPQDPNTIYAVTSSRFYKSTNGGDDFVMKTSGLPSNSSRLTIDISPAATERVYLLSAKTDNSFQGIYISNDSGESFIKTLENEDIFNGSSQAWYDLALSVSDSNPDEMYVGVLNIWKSIDGGNNFYQVNNWSSDSEPAYTHADIHFLRFYDGLLFAGTDGGIYRSEDNANSFESLTTGLAIGQFYKISVSEKDANTIVGGLQDNGGFVRYNETWLNYYGADGMDAANSPLDKNTSYGFIQFGGQLYKSSSGISSYVISAPSGESGNWVTPLVFDHLGNLYAGYSQLYKYENNSWMRSSNYNFGGNLENIEINPLNAEVIYVSKYIDLYKSTDGGQTFGLLPNSFQGSSISSIEVNHNNDSIIYVTTNGSSGQVYKSEDAGVNWINITNNLPSEPKNIIKHQKYHQDNAIYVGTSLGVYYLDDTISEWQVFSTNLPNTHVTDLEISPLEEKITASTYGRGIWQSNIPLNLPDNDIAVVDIFKTMTSLQCGDFIPVISVKNNGKNTINDVSIDYSIDGQPYTLEWAGTIISNEIKEITLGTHVLKIGLHELTYNVSITADAYDDNNYGSLNLSVNKLSENPTIINSFEDEINDQWLVETVRNEGNDLWEMGIPNTSLLNTVASGTKAYITNPNGDYTDQTLSLLYTPCYDLTQILDPVLKFQMAFDIELDWDVLYIEYSTNNGSSWHVLGTADDPNWYNSNSTENALTIGKQWTGTDTTLKEYSYNLSDFTNEPQINFRFHFESDQAVTGEGVLIDDFVIAGEQLAIEDVNLNTAKVFPNPATDLVTISWNESYIGELKVFDITGRLLKTVPVNNKTQISISTEHFNNGLYLIQFSNDDHQLVKKLIIEH